MRDSWEEVSLFKVSEDKSKSFVDGDWIESPYITNVGIRLIQTGNIGIGEFKNKNKKFISEKSFRELSCTEVFPGDILVCRLAEPIGRACIVPDLGQRFITSVDVSILRVSDNYSKNFIYQLLNTEKFLKKAELLSGGSTRQRISRINLGNIKFVVPPLPQQKKIAQILSTCDTILKQTEAAIAKYQALKQGLMHDLFTRGIDKDTGQLRPSYKEAPELYKESELGWIPKEWENSTFRKNIEKNLYGPRFSANDYDENGNVRTIRGMDFSKEGEILYSQSPIALLPISKVNAHLLIDLDVIMVTTADCGLTAVFRKQNFPFIPSAYSVKFRFNGNANPYFIKYYMQTEEGKRQVNKYVRQGTLGNLPGSDVLNFILNLPSIGEQNNIVKRIMVLDQKIETEQQTLEKYQKLKAGLMQDLLSGKVGVEGLLDNKKIRA